MRLQDVADSIVAAENELVMAAKDVHTDAALVALAEAYKRLTQVSSELLASLDEISEQGRQLRADVESL